MGVRFNIIFSVTVISLGLWLFLSIDRGIDWERNPRIKDPLTGARMDPDDLLRLAEIIIPSDKYVNTTNAEERLHDLIHFTNLENLFVLDQYYTKNPQDLIQSGWPVSNQIKCGQQLGWLLNNLNSDKDYLFMKGQLGWQLTTLMDSFGRPEAGLYAGKVTWLGSQKQCARVNLDRWDIRTRYCIGRLKPKWWPRNVTVYPPTAIRVGLCLPETCDTLSFNYHNSSIWQLAKLEFPEFYQDGYDLVSMFCLPDERSPLRKLPTAGYMFLYVIGSWLLIVTVGTFAYEIYYREKKPITIDGKSANEKMNQLDVSKQLMTESEHGSTQNIARQSNVAEKLCEALSLRNSLKAFKTKAYRVRYAAGERVKVDLSFLDGLKSLMTSFIILGHSAYLLQITCPFILTRLEISHIPLSYMAMVLVAWTDTFFIFFGVLFAYNILRKFEPHQLINPGIWLAVNIRIFLRLTPVYLVIHWYSRSVSMYTGSGPWWDYGIDKQTFRGQCLDESWWFALPIVAALRSGPMSFCVPTAWFFVTYLQIALILPLITYILCKLPSNVYRSMFVGFMIIISFLHFHIQVYDTKTFPAKLLPKYGTLVADILDKFETTGYRSALGRLGSVGVGCYIGYLLRQYEIGQLVKWPGWLQNRWTIFIALVELVIFYFRTMIAAIFIKPEDMQMDEATLMIQDVGQMFAWPIAFAVLLIGLSTWLNHDATARFLGHPFWYSLNKLGLCMFLIHWEILYVIFSSNQNAPPKGFVTEGYRNWLIAFFYSAVISFCLHLIVEVPMAKLVTVLEEYVIGLLRPATGTEIKLPQTRKNRSRFPAENRGDLII